MSLVHRQVINAQRLEVNANIVSWAGCQLFQALFVAVNAVLNLTQRALALVVFACFGQGFFQAGQLFIHDGLQILGGGFHESNRGVSHDHRVIVTRGNAGQQAPTVLFGEVGWAGGQNLRARVELVKVTRPLRYQMIRDNHHGLA